MEGSTFQRLWLLRSEPALGHSAPSPSPWAACGGGCWHVLGMKSVPTWGNMDVFALKDRSPDILRHPAHPSLGPRNGGGRLSTLPAACSFQRCHRLNHCLTSFPTWVRFSRQRLGPSGLLLVNLTSFLWDSSRIAASDAGPTPCACGAKRKAEG